MEPRSVFAIDVGSTRSSRGADPKFAWVRLDPESVRPPVGSHSISKLAKYINDDLLANRSVAIGFEAPLFIPVPYDEANLSLARSGEGSRPFSASIGLTVATLALHQAAWLFSALSPEARARVQPTTKWHQWPPAEGQMLLLWEAFVSGLSHSDEDLIDAGTAAKEFCLQEGRLDDVNAVVAERPLSMIAAAAIWSGWVLEVESLREPALVIKPTSSHFFEIGDA